MPTKEFPFTIGADPEFSLMFQNKRLDVMQTMKKVCKDIEWTDNQSGIRTEGLPGEFGWDGCSATGEIRPDPANTIDQCEKNFRALIKEAYKHLSAFSLSTLSTHAPIGGHIHLEIPGEWGEKKTKTEVYKLISFCLPITLSENPISRAIRLKNYGRVNDFRIMEHPNNVYTVELRSPSAEWITNPEVFRATLAYVSLVWNEILHHKESFKKFEKILMKNDTQLKAMHEMAIAEHPLMIKMLFNQIKSAVKQFEFYPQYKADIDLMLNPKKIIKSKNKCNYEIFEGWGFKRNKGKFNKKTFLSKAKTEQTLQDKNLDRDFAREITLPYNNDTNIAPYATALENRMLALEWNPKYRYYLFGLKNGIDFMVAGLDNGTFALGQKLVQTSDDVYAIHSVINRMVAKARDFMPADLIVDKQKGIVFDERPIVAVGIPYAWRKESVTKINTVLEAIWKIEKTSEFKELSIPEPETNKEQASPETQSAEILNTRDSSLAISEVTDNSSQARQLSQQAIQELQRENGSQLVTREEPTLTVDTLADGFIFDDSTSS